MDIPKDPVMLMSFLNMKLRDYYSSIDELCDDLQINKQEIMLSLSNAGFEYDEENKKFW